MRRDRAGSALRGTIAATLATFVALLSHTLAAGSMPGTVGILVPWVLSVAICTVLAGRALSLARLTVAVLLSQGAFHALFTLGTATGTATGGSSAHGSHGSALAPFAVSAARAVTESASMTGAHLLAAALTVAVIYRGELAARQLLALARSAVFWVRARIATVTLTPRPARLRSPLARFERRMPASAVLASSIARRGPPAAVTY